MRISDWSSDVCSSDLHLRICHDRRRADGAGTAVGGHRRPDLHPRRALHPQPQAMKAGRAEIARAVDKPDPALRLLLLHGPDEAGSRALGARYEKALGADRSEEHTSELQSLMRISYAVF